MPLNSSNSGMPHTMKGETNKQAKNTLRQPISSYYGGVEHQIQLSNNIYIYATEPSYPTIFLTLRYTKTHGKIEQSTYFLPHSNHVTSSHHTQASIQKMTLMKESLSGTVPRVKTNTPEVQKFTTLAFIRRRGVSAQLIPSSSNN